MSVAAASSLAAATNVRFVGSVGYSGAFGYALLSADQIHNFDVVGSAALRLELWGTPAPFTGSFTSGYQLASYPLAPLAAGASLNTVSSGMIPYTPPPGGLWYVAMVLTEYTGSATNGGYTPVNYLRFPTQIGGSGPPPTDTTPPTVSIASPTGGNVSGTVTISANASDNVGVTRVDFYVNGALKGSDNAAPYQYSWNTTSLANGPATLRAVAFDAAGHSTQSSLVSVTVANVVTPPPDTTPPTVSITAPTGGNVSGTVTISVNASDNVGVTRVDMLVNGVVAASDNSAPYQFSWNSNTLANGAAQLKAVAYDAAGNLAQSSIVAVNVANVVTPPPDTTPPTITLTSPGGGKVAGIVALTATASDNVGVSRVEFYANGQLVGTDTSAPYQATWDSRNVVNGPATLTARAFDAAGNSGTSASVSVAVANMASPTGPIHSVEYYNSALDHYFITASDPEINALDSGQFVGWSRTGYGFNAYSQPTGAASPVCRFYIPPSAGDSHFYSASSDECALAQVRFPMFELESLNVFYLNLPDTATGACPSGTVPVYRVWNNRSDSNHRYMTEPSLRDQMVAKGYIAEGYGPNNVIMCAPM